VDARREAFTLIEKRVTLACVNLLLIVLVLQVTSQPAIADYGPASLHTFHFSTVSPDTDVQLQWPLNNSNAVSIDLKVVASPENQTSIFWGHQFSFVNGERGYIGFGVGGDVKVATVAIFDANGGATTTPNGGCESGVPFSKSGNGWQCFIIYNWKIGFNYALRLTQLPPDNQGNGQWQGTIHDYSSNTDTVIGAIIVPSTYGMLGSSSSTWNEYSIAMTCPTADTSVIFSSPYAYNAAGNHAPTFAQVTYGNSTCQDSNVQYIGGGAYRADAGKDVTRTTPAQTFMWTQEPSLVQQSSNSVPEFPISGPVILLFITVSGVLYGVTATRSRRGSANLSRRLELVAMIL
jgi:hypothetical protein